MKIYRLEMVLAFALLCFCCWTSVFAQESGSAASVSRTQARSGRGLYHFISDDKDINKVFLSEVQSLISSVAKDVQVSIDYGPGLQLEKIYGYSPRCGNGESESCESLADVEVKKNYTIAELADSLFQMAGLARSGNYAQAQKVLDAAVATAYRRYPNMEDDDIRFIIEIVLGYSHDLRVYNEYSRKHDCGSCR